MSQSCINLHVHWNIPMIRDTNDAKEKPPKHCDIIKNKALKRMNGQEVFYSWSPGSRGQPHHRLTRGTTPAASLWACISSCKKESPHYAAALKVAIKNSRAFNSNEQQLETRSPFSLRHHQSIKDFPAVLIGLALLFRVINEKSAAIRLPHLTTKEKSAQIILRCFKTAGMSPRAAPTRLCSRSSSLVSRLPRP